MSHSIAYSFAPQKSGVLTVVLGQMQSHKLCSKQTKSAAKLTLTDNSGVLHYIFERKI